MGRNLGRYRSSDMIGLASPGARPRRFADQEPEEEPEGELLCRIMQTGTDTWAGHDGKGRSLRIRRGRDGALEIRHSPEAGDAADPDVVGTHPGEGAGVVWGRSSDPAAAATGDGFSRYVKTGKWEHHISALGALQRRLNAYYSGKQ